MRFLLIYPPTEPYFIQKTKARSFYGLSPPLGLLYIAKILENNGDAVTILDYSTKIFNEQTFFKMIDVADAIGMTIISPSLNEVKKIIELIKRHSPDIPIIIGGPHCTLRPKETLEETGAQISVQGDGEVVIQDITKALKGEKALTDIHGITFQTPQGIKCNPPAPIISNLDTIPFPARHLLKHSIYGREYNPLLKAGEFTAVITSRGCPYHCRFCSRSSITMQQYRIRSNDNIIAELNEIKEQGYRHVAFVDDCFPIYKKQTIKLFETLKNEGLDLNYSVTATRVDMADQELYKKMRRAGVTHLQFGLESGNQDVLDFYDKKTTIKMIQRAVHLSHETGFFTIGSFIFGAPFETKEQFQQTLSFAKSLPLDSVSFLPLRYMVGSDLWNKAVAEEKITEKEYIVLADKQRELGQYSAEELLKFCMNAQYSFYARPTFFIHLLKKSLHNNDMSFMKSFLSTVFSTMK